MKWKKFTIQTTTAAEDFISEKLSEIGIEGIEIEDKVELTANDTKGMFIDVLPDLGPEGGFEDEEIAQAENCGAQAITLGRRILRTETAGMAVLAMLGYVLEE